MTGHWVYFSCFLERRRECDRIGLFEQNNASRNCCVHCLWKFLDLPFVGHNICFLFITSVVSVHSVFLSNHTFCFRIALHVIPCPPGVVVYLAMMVLGRPIQKRFTPLGRARHDFSHFHKLQTKGDQEHSCWDTAVLICIFVVAGSFKSLSHFQAEHRLSSPQQHLTLV